MAAEFLTAGLALVKLLCRCEGSGNCTTTTTRLSSSPWQVMGDQAADHLLAEHQGVKQLLYALDGQDVSQQPQFDETLSKALTVSEE